MSNKHGKGSEKFSGPFYSDDSDDLFEEEDEWTEYTHGYSKSNRQKTFDKHYAKKPKKIVRESDWN